MPTHCRSSTLTGFRELAQSLSLPAERMMREAGLDPACLDDPDNWIEAGAVVELLERSALLANVHDFGLRMAALRRLSTLGPVSVVLHNEDSGMAALETIHHYLRIINESIFLKVEEERGLVAIHTAVLVPGAASHRQATELLVGAGYQVLRELLGPQWEPRQVSFTHAPPASAARHLRFFRHFVTFNAEFNGIVCRVQDLQKPLLYADQGIVRYGHDFLDSLCVPDDSSYEERVRKLIMMSLPSGDCTAQGIAARLGVNRRTLHRHLAQCGQTFSGLLNTVRAELALRYAGEGARPAGEIAAQLGFSGPSSFSRWFQSEFGMSLTDFRRL